MLRRPLRHLLRSVQLLLVLIILYLLAAALTGWLSINRQWQGAQGADSIPIYLTTNGIHADLVMPVKSQYIDWSTRFPTANLRSQKKLERYNYISVGWGSRRFFLETKEWADLTIGNALYVLSGQDGSVLHIEYQPEPKSKMGEDIQRIMISPTTYQQLIRYIQQATTLNQQGQPIWVKDRHYYSNDAFYLAEGHYSLFNTCNEWIRAALANMGVRTAWWAPFDKPLFWQLDS